MNIEPTIPNAPLAAAPPNGSATAWPVGAVLTARRTGRDAGGRIALRIADQEVLAEAPPDVLLPGTFRVRVGRGGVRPELELLPDRDDAADSLPDQKRDEALERARTLLALIPRQSGLGFLMSELDAWLQAPASDIPEALAPALDAVAAALPPAGAFADAAAALRTLEDAGLLFEARLSGAAAAPADPAATRDWKAALVRLAGALARQPHVRAAADPGSAVAPPITRDDLPPQPRPRPAPGPDPSAGAAQGRLLQAAEGVIARIGIAQLCAQQDDPSWLFELPMRGRGGFDVLQIRLFRSPAEGGQASGWTAPGWTALVAVDFPALGAIGCEMGLRGSHLRIGLWAELAAVARRIEAALPDLAGRLRRDGLNVELLTCRYGRPNRSLVECGRLFSSVA